MGVTYRAFDTNLRCDVALKVINTTYLNSEMAGRRFEREARAAAQLNHANVARVFHLGQEGGNFFYAMEYINGETLEALIKRKGVLPPLTALKITLQVARALGAAAKLDLVHRDIKPANLMLLREDDDEMDGSDNDLFVKVIDFGLARAFHKEGAADASGQITMAGFVGTPDYASPEQREEKDLDVRSDFYSLGVTLWYMLMGRPPFTGSMGQVMSQHLTRRPPFEQLPKMPPPVLKLIERMLEKDPALRQQTPTDLRKEIDQAITSLDSSARASVTASISAEATADLARTIATSPEAPETREARQKLEELLFGNFQVLTDERGNPQLLGKGTFGRTYKARHRYVETIVALKVVNERFATDPVVRQRFLVEGRAVAKLSHPNIARLYDFGEKDGLLYYAMDYCDGGDLAGYVTKNGALTGDRLMQVAREMASALQSAHSANHRDIKPSNIMLLAGTAGGFATKLIDFGLVHAVAPTAETAQTIDESAQGQAKSRFVGTPLFASPEQLREEQLDARSDLFSLGMTLWHLAIGGSPEGGSLAQIATSRLNAESYGPRITTNLPPELQACLPRLLEKDRSRRMATADELVRALAPATGADAASRAEPLASATMIDVAPAAEPEIAAVPGTGLAPIEELSQPLETDWALYGRHSESMTGENYLAESTGAGREPRWLHVLKPAVLADAGLMETLRRHVATLAGSGSTAVFAPLAIRFHPDFGAVVLDRPESSELLTVLRAHPKLGLPEALPLLDKLAQAADSLVSAGLPPPDLHAGRIFLRAAGTPEAPVPLAEASPLLFPKLLAASEAPSLINEDDSNASGTMTDNMLGDPSQADNVQGQFANLIYRMVAGRDCPQAASLAAQAYVSIPGLSEPANRFLSMVISQQLVHDSCGELLRQLLQSEGLSGGHGTAGQASGAATRSREGRPGSLGGTGLQAFPPTASRGPGTASQAFSPAASRGPGGASHGFAPAASRGPGSSSAGLSPAASRALGTAAPASSATASRAYASSAPGAMRRDLISSRAGTLGGTQTPPPLTANPPPLTATQTQTGTVPAALPYRTTKTALIAVAAIVVVLIAVVGFAVVKWQNQPKNPSTSDATFAAGTTVRIHTDGLPTQAVFSFNDKPLTTHPVGNDVGVDVGGLPKKFPLALAVEAKGFKPDTIKFGDEASLNTAQQAPLLQRTTGIMLFTGETSKYTSASARMVDLLPNEKNLDQVKLDRNEYGARLGALGSNSVSLPTGLYTVSARDDNRIAKKVFIDTPPIVVTAGETVSVSLKEPEN